MTGEIEALKRKLEKRRGKYGFAENVREIEAEIARLEAAPLTPYDFGAVGDSGADDTAAMQEFLDGAAKK